MTIAWKIRGVRSAAILLAAFGFVPMSRDSRAQPPPPQPSFRGAGSCSATACHGGPAPVEGRVLRDEHTTWIRRDRHADAYSVLFGERSRSIAANLNDGLIPADKDARCLACHASPGREPAAASRPALLMEGVGCESCHGAADRWIGPHTRWDWDSRPMIEKERLGMIATADLGRRAKLCAICHVGEPARDGRPARDVDHELIAAGHPRLNFELSAYLATMPHHWRDDAGPDSTADFPARAWMIGQLASAKAAVDLTKDRAARSGPKPQQDSVRGGNWPEFSEYSCFSCHHDLRDETWRRARREGPGSPRWGAWHFAMIPELGPNPDAQVLRRDIEDLRKLMAAPRPEPAEVVRRAGILSGLFERQLKVADGRSLDAAAVEALLKAALAASADGEHAGWEQAAQRYLALVPLRQSFRSLAPGRVEPGSLEELARLRDVLRFPQGSDSPKLFDPARLPAGLKPF